MSVNLRILCIDRRSLKLFFRFIGWFFFANALVFFLVSFRYLFEIVPFAISFPSLEKEIIVSLFVAVTMVGHFSLLAFLPILAAVPWVFIVRKIFWIQVISVGLASVALAFLVIDTFVFKQFHYHLHGIILKMLFSKEAFEVFHLPLLDWLLVACLFFVIILLEVAIAYKVLQIVKDKADLHGKVVAAVLAICLFFSYQMFMLGGVYLNLSLTQQARAFPLFNNFLAMIVPLPDSLTRVESLGSGHFVQPKQVVRPLRYPLKTLQFEKPSLLLNLLIIVIDTWRFDMVDKDVMPFVSHFADKTWQFNNHWSGGNSTQAGMFSLFYGLPGTYWASMLDKQQGPVLIKALQESGYQMGVYASAELTVPALNRTIFVDVSDLSVETPGDTPYIRDQVITQKFFHFLEQAKKSKKPFFSLLFYDAAHAYCLEGNPIQKFQPAVALCKRYALNNDSDPLPYLNRYKNALMFVDKQIGAVLERLEQQGLLKNTVVIVTGDHGQEFNDNHCNYWEHAGNYTRYQVQTPLLIYYPGEKPAKFNHWTSHFDIAPTLMAKLLGCLSSPSDFSVGHFILNKASPAFLIVSSYIDFGIVEPDQTTTIYATGNYAIHDDHHRLLSNDRLRLPTLQAAFREINAFYRPWDHQRVEV